MRKCTTLNTNVRPRILLVSHNSNLSGAPISLAQLAKGLVSLGYAPLLVLPKSGPVEQFLQQWKVEYAVLKTPNAILDYLRIIRRFKPDVVHVNSLVKTWPVLLARLCGKPTIWHVREYLGKKRGYARLIHLTSKKVVLVSQEQGILFQGMPNAVVVPNGIAVGMYENLSPAPDIRRNGAKIFVVYVGTIEPRKGLFVLAQTAALLKDRPWIHFLVAGDAPKKHEAYKLKVYDYIRTQDLQKRIHFLGYRNDIPSILAAADILLHPAFFEVFPRVVLEAMATRLPIIATRVGGIPEMIENGVSGYLVDAGDFRAMARYVRELDEHGTLRKNLGSNGYERARKKFSLASHVEKIVEIYESMI